MEIMDGSEQMIAGTQVNGEASPRLALASHERLLRAAAAMPWAIWEDKAREILAFLEFRAAGGQTTAEEREQFRAAAPSGSQQGSVAVLPLYGVIAQRMNLMDAMSGGTSTEAFTQRFRQALSNPDVAAIVLNVDSPGGSVFGVDELAAEIRQARGTKPIVAVANSLMASAAYWIGAQADELVVTPGGLVGSIGVLSVHVDQSAQNEMLGLKPTIISAGKFKAEGSEDFPLAQDAIDYRQAQVNQYYDSFVGAVASGRGVPVSTVRGGFGEGRVVRAKQAVAMGMADRVATLDQTIQRLMTAQGRAAIGRKANAEADYFLPLLTAEEPALPPTIRQAERALTGCGLSQSQAKAILAQGWSPYAREVLGLDETVTDDDPREVGAEPGEDAEPTNDGGETAESNLDLWATELALLSLTVA